MPQDDAGESGHPSVREPRLPTPNFDHLRHLTDQRGLWEHARHTNPRPDHGFCNEDNARALVVVAREPRADLTDLATVYLGFVLGARMADGRFHNRMDSNGAWVDDVGSDDSQGRAWWGLGAIGRQAPEEWMRIAAGAEFESATTFESSHLRANAYAALGAAELVDRNTVSHQAAVDLLDRTTTLIATAARSTIPWPETRLTYDNARIPEALIAAGFALDDERRTSLGLRLLDWLVVNESRGDRFSFTPVGGRTPGERGPSFDQQPIEAWAMADACNRAQAVTGEPRWSRTALRAAWWLLGENDCDATMYRYRTGGTHDGLTSTGVNSNQGAESTLAGLGALQAVAASRRR